jgi:hypothetical protein
MHVDFLRDVLAADLDFTLVLPSAGEVEGDLHSQPGIAAAAEDAVTFLLAAEEAYKRRTGRDLSPDVAAAFLRQSAPKPKFG